ncbi:hypothetical protein JB92DRAFT_2706819, partial [Gautieria morchelliformis]
FRYATGFLRRHNFKVQRDRVCEALRCINGLGCALRHRDAILRCKYVSHHSGSVVHIDGHHKLILWGIIIHGMIDGHDHVVSAHIL